MFTLSVVLIRAVVSRLLGGRARWIPTLAVLMGLFSSSLSIKLHGETVEKSSSLTIAADAPRTLSNADQRIVNFTNDVMPVLTKAGCNAGVCHAKAGGGQNGFELSLLGFEPREDYEHLVKEGRGRRLFRQHLSKVYCFARQRESSHMVGNSLGARIKRIQYGS